MPILLVFGLIAACAPVRWRPPLVGGGEATATGLTAAFIGLSLTAAVALRVWVVRTLRREPGRKPEVITAYARFRRLMFFTNLAIVALCILVFGWGWFVQKEFLGFTPRGSQDFESLPPFAELAVPLPYFLILFGAWTIYYDAERSLCRTSLLGPIDRPFWSRVGYFVHHLRQFLLLVMLPVVLLVTQQSLERWLPYETTRSVWYQAGWYTLIPVLGLLMPLVIKPLLGLKSMPRGPERDRLESLAKRLHFRCTDFLLWPTHGAIANAMIVGLLPRVRYVIFTDRILEELQPEELDAVFGHEVGHAKHGHMWLYLAFLLLSVAVLAALWMWLMLPSTGGTFSVWLRGWIVSNQLQDWIALVPVFLLGTYMFLVFGFVSRRCERQADIYGCRAVSCDDPNCTGHNSATRYPERARGLCNSGIHTFARALEHVNYINGQGAEEVRGGRSLRRAIGGVVAWFRHWMHSTPQRRIDFIMSLTADHSKERRFQRAVAVLRWGLLLGLLCALVALGEAIGWHNLVEEM